MLLFGLPAADKKVRLRVESEKAPLIDGMVHKGYEMRRLIQIPQKCVLRAIDA